VGRDRLLILESEEFFSDPAAVYARLLRFLDLPAWRPQSFRRHNARPSAPMPADLRARLEAEFRPHDDALARLIGREPAWRQACPHGRRRRPIPAGMRCHSAGPPASSAGTGWPWRSASRWDCSAPADTCGGTTTPTTPAPRS